MEFVIYSLIGVGEILILITPFLENRLNSPLRRNLHMLLASSAPVAILCYGLIPNIRMGIDPLREGYYWMAASFLLAALSSVLHYITRHGEQPSRP